MLKAPPPQKKQDILLWRVRRIELFCNPKKTGGVTSDFNSSWRSFSHLRPSHRASVHTGTLTFTDSELYFIKIVGSPLSCHFPTIQDSSVYRHCANSRNNGAPPWALYKKIDEVDPCISLLRGPTGTGLKNTGENKCSIKLTWGWGAHDEGRRSTDEGNDMKKQESRKRVDRLEKPQGTGRGLRRWCRSGVEGDAGRHGLVTCCQLSSINLINLILFTVVEVAVLTGS